MTGDVAFAIGTASPVDKETTKLGVVTTGGAMTGVEALLETGATGAIEGCAFWAGTGVIWGFAALLGLGQGQLGAWFAVTVIHTVTVVVCVCGVTVTVNVSVCA